MEIPQNKNKPYDVLHSCHDHYNSYLISKKL